MAVGRPQMTSCGSIPHSFSADCPWCSIDTIHRTSVAPKPQLTLPYLQQWQHHHHTKKVRRHMGFSRTATRTATPKFRKNSVYGRKSVSVGHSMSRRSCRSCFHRSGIERDRAFRNPHCYCYPQTKVCETISIERGIVADLCRCWSQRRTSRIPVGRDTDPHTSRRTARHTRVLDAATCHR